MRNNRLNNHFSAPSLERQVLENAKENSKNKDALEVAEELIIVDTKNKVFELENVLQTHQSASIMHSTIETLESKFVSEERKTVHKKETKKTKKINTKKTKKKLGEF